MSLRSILSPNPRLTREEYDLAQRLGRKGYAVRGALRMARWLLMLSVVILGAKGYTSGNWALMLTWRVAGEVFALIVACSAFVGYTTYALIWKALGRMFGPGLG
ncbi:MAG TPA: hypothetical protein VFT41_11655 [Gemmatimonadaceae bacterium]|nr:hypothetical protein [Gemmatimonadaceae bacterium]